MSRALFLSISITDFLFMTYWLIAGLALFDIFSLPPDLMYGDYTNPRVVAWNWSFFPLDLIFSIFGYLAISASGRGDPIWRQYALISLVLTMTAGGMAVVYWAILKEFDPAWFIPNSILLIWPLFFIGKLIAGGRDHPTGAVEQT
ncbi:MAG: DUF5360 family protein [Pseudomonadota bacterium]